MAVQKLDCHRYVICERLGENRFIIFFFQGVEDDDKSHNDDESHKLKKM